MLTSVASAQKNLVIYHVSGTVNIITNDKGSPAVRGSAVKKNNYLQLKQNSTCMLIAAGGKSLQLSDAGTYSFQNLQELFSKEKTNEVTKKFFGYVYDNFFSSNKSEPLAITPVVFRGEKLMLLPSDNSIIISDAVTFTWRKPVIKTPVRLTIRDNAQKIIIDSVIRKANSLQINFSEFGINPKQVYEWKIEESDTHQPKNYFLHFLVAGKTQAKKIMLDLKLLQDKKISSNLRQQMGQDIFEKWKTFYSTKAGFL